MSRAAGVGTLAHPTLTPSDSEPDPLIFNKHLLDITQSFFDYEESILAINPGHGSCFGSRGPTINFGFERNEKLFLRAEGKYTGIVGDPATLTGLLNQIGPNVANWFLNLTRCEGAEDEEKLLDYVHRAMDDESKFVAVHWHERIVLDSNLHDGVFAVLRTNLFAENCPDPIYVTFGVHPAVRQKMGEGNVGGHDKKDNITVDFLDLLPAWVANMYTKYTAQRGMYCGRGPYSYRIKENFALIEKQYNKLLKPKKNDWSVSMYGKDSIQVHLTDWDRAVLVRQSRYNEVHHLHGRTLNYLVNNLRYWRQLIELEENECLTIQPKLKERMELLLIARERTICPINPIGPNQRLGWLTDEDKIECIIGDSENGFIKGHKYKVDAKAERLETTEERVVFEERGKNAGTYVKKKFRRKKVSLYIYIKNEWGVTKTYIDSQENQEDIGYVTKHFEIKDPGDVATKFPDEYAYWFNILKQVEAEKIIPCSKLWAGKNPEDPPAVLRKFQIDQLARMLVKGSGLIAWEPGLGKTVAGPAVAESLVKAQKCKDAVLFIIPQDLHDQWLESNERFYGRKLHLIKKPWEARRVKEHIRNGGTGWFVTDYDKMTQHKKERDDDFVVYVESKRVWNPKTRQYEDREKAWTTAQCCPRCRSKKKDGYNGEYCKAKDKKTGKQCGYRHLKFKTPTIASILATAFKDGVIVLDEATQMQGANSQRSEAIRGMRAKYRFTLTGTPIKNYVVQAFWPMWWTCGNNSERFPFGYGDRSKFERDHQVYEEVWYGKNWGNGKAIAEICNLATLWRYLCSFTARCRKQDTNENLVPLKMHVQEVPMGQKQASQYAHWLEHFPNFFAQKYPTSPLVKSGAYIPMAPMLGLGWKLDYSATAPKEDPDHEWTGITDVSNFTPNNFQTLVLAMSLVAQGKKVLIGSNFKDYGPWIAAQLQAKGINAAHLVGPNGQTASPAKRAKLVKEFRRGKVQVLCAGTSAIRLGHNLDNASACILNGLPWDYETYFQFRERVHRFTSKRPVDIYVVLPASRNDTITQKKWQLINGKQDAASLALDGTLFQQDHEKMTKEKALAQLSTEGFRLAGDEISEQSIQSKWLGVPRIEHFQIPTNILGNQAKPKEETGVKGYKEVWEAVVSHTGSLQRPFPSTHTQPWIPNGGPTEVVIKPTITLEDKLDAYDAYWEKAGV
jgi:hypothetical protein